MSTKRITLAALFMALVIILSSSYLSVPVPGGHFYINGIVICLTGLLFPPTESVIVAGIGSFIGDFLFYPTPMFVTLISHSLQVLVVSFLVKQSYEKLSKSRFFTALVLGGILNLIGYFLGRSFLYANLPTALVKLPFDSLAAVLSILMVYFIYYHTRFVTMFKQAWEN
ncbi:Predicted membrane protein [Streptococcus criceti]|uniref:ECF transporter S component n=1 Tax=Streptococcus criceti HS-6 TaxID=873449 RepID=G5JMZ4_STRCG|nr:ECF transporter S component [Streptococcus criceti]EHI75335.1 hypothetical protein STRCR_1326 [Streptococcus criceti HS-6]SUN38852.1 Predicted membrane protein [Streptococcus criceti]